MYFHSLEKISQKLHLEKQHILRNCVFLKNNLKKKKNNLLVTNPKARPRREYDWDHESMDLGTLGWRQV